MILRIFYALLIAFGGYFFGSMVSGMATGNFTGPSWLMGLAMQAGMLVYALAFMLIMGRGKLAGFGFAMPSSRQCPKAAVWGLAIGVVTAIIEIIAGMDEHPMAKDMTVWQMIGVIWIGASICEEVFFRGLLQSFLAPLSNRGFHLGGVRFSAPVVIAAALFAVSHFGLLTMGMSFPAVLVTVIFTLALGTTAGFFREKTGSLIPAIIAHACGNIGGSIGFLFS